MASYDDAALTPRPLIAASRVTGTAVYGAEGTRLGSLHDLMIEKQTGQVAYAVLSFGGFLGIGNRYHPLPWSGLRYEPAQGGYVVVLSREQIEGAPSYESVSLDSWNEDIARDIDSYYHGSGLVPPPGPSERMGVPSVTSPNAY